MVPACPLTCPEKQKSFNALQYALTQSPYYEDILLQVTVAINTDKNQK